MRLPFGRAARRARVLERRPLDDGLWARALKGLPIVAAYPESRLAALRDAATVFLAEKSIIALHGATVAEAEGVRIAAMACLPALAPGLDALGRFSSVFVVPEGYTLSWEEVDEDGLAHEVVEEVSGQAMEAGHVVLALPDVAMAGTGTGYNVVIHEMAHKLDDSDGEGNGMPWLTDASMRREWAEALDEALGSLQRGLMSPRGRRRGRGRGFDEYAAESPPEFFAVASEYYFERPAYLTQLYPRFYACLDAYYGAEAAPLR